MRKGQAGVPERRVPLPPLHRGGSILLITLNLWLTGGYYGTLGESPPRLFQVGTIISTTGSASTNFYLWPEFSRILLVLLMFVGACAGSTGGALKCSRVLVLLKCVPGGPAGGPPRSVNVVKLDGKVVSLEALHPALLRLYVHHRRVHPGGGAGQFSFGTTLTAVVACIGNIGPRTGTGGAHGQLRWLLLPLQNRPSMCMIVGRLELLPILVLF